ncbi:MAG TPA: large conductance mechanosensitive channel protein MscL [Pyrinomonadaceae bacterium]|nr:large conductance mechanosensitive channel protein MscL [Pyrinomonadaceae bacterium]
MLKEFRDFIAKGNVLDLAVAVIIGAAFGKIISSLVEGVIMPPIGLLLGKVDFSNLIIDLSGQHPASLADAKAKGLPVIAYGAFLNDVITFLIVALVVFLVVKAVNKMQREKPAAATTKDCPYCLSSIPIAATRCSGCTSELPAAI